MRFLLDSMIARPGLIPNDALLVFSLSCLLFLVFYEVYKTIWKLRKAASHSKTKTNQILKKKHISRALPVPAFEGSRSTLILDAVALCRYVPVSSYNIIKFSETNILKSIPTASTDLSASNEEEGEDEYIGLPAFPGCEIDGFAASELAKQFPSASRGDIVRFLVARKGNVEVAAEMMKKALAWHLTHLPLRPSPEILRALSTKCFFPHGFDRDGAPVLYFRGALYDSTKASADVYVLAAAHAIDWALRRSRHTAITCLVHAAPVDGAPNEGTDTNFIKGFVSTLSDNFPERLKKLAIYPFPWYGRAIWAIVKVFVDKRTQDKVLLVPHSGRGLPAEIEKIVDPSQVPEACGGLDRSPLVDLETTLAPLDEPVDDTVDTQTA